MILNAGNILLIGSILLFISIVVGKAGFRFGVPALLLFLGVGMLFGTDGLGIEFNNPQTAQFIGVIALSIILFSGGMDTSAAEIKPVLGQGIVLATAGVMFTAFLTGYFIYYITNLENSFVTHKFHRIIVTRLRHVIYRFRIRVLDPPFQTTRTKREFTPHARAGKW